LRTNYIKLISVNFILLSILLSLIGIAGCVPASPYPVKFTQPDNSTFFGYVRGDERASYVETSGYVIERDEDKWWKYVTNDSQGNLVVTDYKVGVDNPYGSGVNNKTTLQDVLNISLLNESELMQFPTQRITPSVGNAECVVILIRFSDVAPQGAHTSSYFNNLLFNSANSSSMNRYYTEVSYGNLNVNGVVSKWYQSSKTMKYYGQDTPGYLGSDDYNVNIFELTREAVKLANNDIDFSQYDKNGDGVVDHVIIVHAGEGQENSDNPDTIWSHKWQVYPGEPVDGVTVGEYTMLAEDSPIGTFAHEFGHDLGLPDLYDRDYSSLGVGIWDLMADGSWLNSGNTPSHLSAYCKCILGWVSPVEVTSSMLGEQISDVEDNSRVYMLSGNSNNLGSGNGEYFLVENREKKGFDAYLPGGGLLLWNIDESVDGNQNDDENYKLVDLEDADGQNHLDDINLGNAGDAGDSWANSENGFNGNSNPNSKFYNGSQSNVEVKNIGSSGATMIADLIVPDLNSEMPILPGCTHPPTDVNYDGLYEDLNGNGILDFDDIVTYYDNMDWIGDNAPVALFDYNINSLIDFDDIVKLYDML
jgi:immune inhibitor A